MISTTILMISTAISIKDRGLWNGETERADGVLVPPSKGAHVHYRSPQHQHSWHHHQHHHRRRPPLPRHTFTDPFIKHSNQWGTGLFWCCLWLSPHNEPILAIQAMSYWISITWVWNMFCFSMVFILTDHYVQMLATLNATLSVFPRPWSKSNGEWVSGDNIRKECCRTCFIRQRNSRSKLWLLPL